MDWLAGIIIGITGSGVAFWVLARDQRRQAQEQRCDHARAIGRLEAKLERATERERTLLRQLSGLEDVPTADAPLAQDVMRARLEYAGLTGVSVEEQEARGRPAWSEPESGEWSVDGLSSSLDDDPLPDLPPYLPTDVETFVEPVVELEQGGRERVVGISPGENPFQGLVGLDPNA